MGNAALYVIFVFCVIAIGAYIGITIYLHNKKKRLELPKDSGLTINFMAKTMGTHAAGFLSPIVVHGADRRMLIRYMPIDFAMDEKGNHIMPKEMCETIVEPSKMIIAPKGKLSPYMDIYFILPKNPDEIDFFATEKFTQMLQTKTQLENVLSDASVMFKKGYQIMADVAKRNAMGEATKETYEIFHSMAEQTQKMNLALQNMKMSEPSQKTDVSQTLKEI